LTPDVAGRVPLSESQLAAAVETASARPVTAYVDTGAGQALMERPPPKGRIVKTAVKGDVTEWTLSNGATVALLPTTLKADQILFLATAPGGTSLASDADFFAARVADDVIPRAGSARSPRW
jgi:zinc protease